MTIAETLYLDAIIERLDTQNDLLKQIIKNQNPLSAIKAEPKRSIKTMLNPCDGCIHYKHDSNSDEWICLNQKSIHYGEGNFILTGCGNREEK